MGGSFVFPFLGEVVHFHLRADYQCRSLRIKMLKLKQATIDFPLDKSYFLIDLITKKPTPPPIDH